MDNTISAILLRLRARNWSWPRLIARSRHSPPSDDIPRTADGKSHWITKELDKLAESIDAGDPHGIEFHASEIYSRRSVPWKGLSTEEARGFSRDPAS